MDEQTRTRRSTGAQEGEGRKLTLRLYVAGDSPNSMTALGNLQALGTGPLGGEYDLEIVDVMRNPLRALQDDILVTPTLVKVAPHPPCRIVGNLSDSRTVLLSLCVPP